MVLAFAASWALKVAHHWCMHHTHREVPVCAAAHQGTAKHLHDERYNPDDCSICAFIFAVPELVTVSVPLARTPVVLRRLLPAYSLPFISTQPNTARLRGPPVV